MGETARQLSDRIGKIMQDRESVSINSSDTSVSHSTQLESAIPPSKIAMLTSGQFFGIVADEPAHPIKLKAFHAEIIKDHDASRKQEQNMKDIPIIRHVTQEMVEENYQKIKDDVQYFIDKEYARIKDSPEYRSLQNNAKGNTPPTSL